MKQYKVNEKCIGCMACVRVAEEHFALDDQRRAHVTRQPEDEAAEALMEKALEACPTEAIVRVEEVKGEPVLGSHNVRDTLEKHPELKEVLLSLSPKFKRLLNPAMYNSVARFATFDIASRSTGISLCEILHGLNKVLGLEEELMKAFPACLGEQSVEADAQAEEKSSAIRKDMEAVEVEELVLDVRKMGQDPFDVIVKAAHGLGAGEAFQLVQTFKPEPMIKMLTAMDFDYELLQEAPGEVRMKFTKKEGTQPETDSGSSVGAEKPSLTIQSATPVGYPIIMKLLQSQRLKQHLDIKELKVWDETEKHLAWIVNGRADISFSAVITATKFKDANVKMPAVFVWDNFVLLTRNTEAKRLEDLKGETIRLPLFEDAPPAKITRYLLEAEGLAMEDFDFRYGNPFGRPKELLAAFASGNADHVLLREPEASFAAAAARANGLSFGEIGYGKLFDEANPGFGEFPNAGVIVKESLYRDYPETMQVFEEELEAAIGWVVSHPREAAELSFDMMRSTVDTVESFINRVHFHYLAGEALEEKMKQFYTILADNGILPVAVDETLLDMFRK